MTPAPPPAEISRANLLVLAACTIGLAINVSTLFNGTLTTFVKPMALDTGWSRTQISLGLSAVAGSLLLALPLIGRLIDRVGPRRVLLFSVPLFSIALSAFAWAPRHYGFHIAVCILVGLTGAGGYASLYFSVLSRRFDRRLGLAVGIGAVGAGLGFVVTPLLSQWLIDVVGWRGAYAGLAAANFAVLFPVAVFVLRDLPLAPVPTGAAVGRPRVLGSLSFWRVCFAYFLAGVAITGTFVHLAPLLTDRGLTGSMAAIYVSVFGLSALVTRLAAGVALDYVDPGLLGAVGFSMAAVGVMLLAGSTDPHWMMVAVILVGAALGAEGDILPVITRRLFGLEAYGALIGTTLAAFMTGSMLGPLIAGAVYDASGSYRWVMLGFAGAAVLAAAVHFSLTRGRPAPDAALRG